jgi:hypothetical protein
LCTVYSQTLEGSPSIERTALFRQELLSIKFLNRDIFEEDHSHLLAHVSHNLKNKEEV